MSASLALAVADEAGISRVKLDLIKQQIARGATDEELALFLYVAKRAGLDPLARQIYCIKRWDTTLNREVMSTQVSIDGLRLIADRTGRYAPGRAPTFEDRNGKPYSATSYVMKYVQGTWLEVAATAHYNEYAQTKKDGTPTRMWAEKPRIMLAKCAEALALRRAFPAEMSGLYTGDEMGTTDTPTPASAAPVVVDASTGEIVGEIVDAEVSEMPADDDAAIRQAADIAAIIDLFRALRTSDATIGKTLAEYSNAADVRDLSPDHAAALRSRLEAALAKKQAA